MIMNDEMLGIVLAGGKGTRLGKLTQNQAKPAVPFGGRYRIIDFTMSNCVNSGIRNIGVITQYQPWFWIGTLVMGPAGDWIVWTLA